MPYTSEKIKLPRELDRRVKLTEKDKEDIKHRHKQGEAIRGIARAYEGVCSRRLIQFVLFPERSRTSNYSGHWKKYYVKEKNTKAIREWRNRKQKLYVSGVIKQQMKNKPTQNSRKIPN
jgi:hypothetical protein